MRGNKMKKYELMCQYDNRKSFGGKAVVEEDKKELRLFSYNTLVAKINIKSFDGVRTDTIEVFNTQSTTTVRHIKEFARQNGFGVYTNKGLEELKELNK